MKRYINHIIRSTEKRVDKFLGEQVNDNTSLFHGGIPYPIYDVKPTVFIVADAVAVYANKQSKYYHSDILKTALHNALDFIGKAQREDGSFDYPSCNFRSAPDTSFCFERLICAYRILMKYEASESQMIQKIKTIMVRSLTIFLEGGFHTPNHRWAISAGLMQGVGLVEEESRKKQLLDRVQQYLNEGIDGNEEGEYAERSTGTYNAVVNASMITLYEEYQDEFYLDFVERNLKMMLYYFDPDDTVFTQNSTRQDLGRADYPYNYFSQFLYLAAQKKDSIFENAAHKLIKDNMERGDMAPDCLHTLMLHQEMEHYELNGYGFLETYDKFFKETGVIRAKRGDFGYSLLKGKSAFAFLKFKDTMIYLKIGESYCDIRNFIPQTMEMIETASGEKEYVLSSTAKGWYYLPFEEKQNTSDWWEMDHKKRKLQISSELTIHVHIKELSNGLEFTIESEGLDRFPLRIELGVPADSMLNHESFYLQANKGGNMILRDGYISLQHNCQKIKIGPGFGTHEFGGHYSGEEKNNSGFTIYLNDYTPLKRTFQIVSETSKNN